eukprot:642165-Amphidinium_carterae.1
MFVVVQSFGWQIIPRQKSKSCNYVVCNSKKFSYWELRDTSSKPSNSLNQEVIASSDLEGERRDMDRVFGAHSQMIREAANQADRMYIQEN